MSTNNRFAPTPEEDEIHGIFHTLRVQTAEVVEGFSHRVMQAIEHLHHDERGGPPPWEEVALGFVVQIANLFTTALRGEHETETDHGADDA